MAQNRVEEKAGQAAHKTPPNTRYLRTTLHQLLVMACLAPPVFLLMGVDTMVSFLCGAACAVVPQAYFAIRMSRAGSMSARQAAQRGLAAEGGKFLLSAALFALVFAVVKPGAPGTVFLSFSVFWIIQFFGSVALLKASGNAANNAVNKEQ